jgi:hypothetical protein
MLHGVAQIPRQQRAGHQPVRLNRYGDRQLKTALETGGPDPNPAPTRDPTRDDLARRTAEVKTRGEIKRWGLAPSQAT